MSNLRETLRNLIENLSEKNYEETLAQYRFWLDLGIAHGHVVQGQVENDARQLIQPDQMRNDGEFTHPTAHLFFRFVRDMEDRMVSRSASEYHKHQCAKAVADCFEINLELVKNGSGWSGSFLTDINLIAHWANLGFVEESVIRNHILQSLISHPKLHNHQADALVILFRLAGATFETYADPSVLDRCFQLLEGHCSHGSAKLLVKRKVKQDLFELRARGWKGLPPPPVFPTRIDQKDPTATPVTASLGLPSGDLAPQNPQHPPLEPITTPEIDTVPVSPLVQSPSVSVSALSDFTIGDVSDDESPLDPIDPTSIVPHNTFYLEDGNVEVLCGNTLFRVHTSILSFHSPALRQMFAQSSLPSPEPPNGCPRILSSDSATDFSTLLKLIYLPGFPEQDKVPDFATFSSLLRITAKYELPTVRPRLLEVVRSAYPEALEGLIPSKLLGESIFGGPTPHPNAVLNLFVQQKLASALPMAYYMAARRGLDSLMDKRLPRSAALSPEILQPAIRGLLKLREMELKETYHLIFGKEPSYPCSSSKCPSRKTAGPRVSDAHQKVFDQITDSSQSGTKFLQVLSLAGICGSDCHGFCKSCVEGWEAGHVEVRKKVWAALPDVFVLKG